MTEREGSPLKWLKSNLSAFWHQTARIATEIPFAIRVVSAPDGEMVRKGEVTAEGRIVDYSRGTKVIFTSKGSIVFPNLKAGDEIRPAPHKG